MKTRQTFALSLTLIFTIVILATNISYAHEVMSLEGKVESSLSRSPGVSILKMVEPNYPPLAKAARICGMVKVEIVVDGTGSVTSAKVLSGHPLLKDASIAAARKWEFTPVSFGEATKEMHGTITFDYIITVVRKDLEKALQEVQHHPDSPKAHAVLAYSYKANGSKDEAIEEYEAVIQLKPDYHEDIYLELASLYHPYNEEHDKRMDAYQRGLQIFPESVLLLKGMGRVVGDIGRYSEAIEIYQKALLREPQDVDLLCATAELYQNLLRFEDSLEFLQRAILIDSINHIAKEKTGIAYLELGRLDEAEAYLKESVALSAHTAYALEYLGEIYERRGNIEMAVQTWEKALARTCEASQRARIEEKLKAHSK